MATLAYLERENYHTPVQLPIRKEVYQPILKELEEYGVVLTVHDLLWLCQTTQSRY
jgi:hypothetical protein